MSIKKLLLSSISYLIPIKLKSFTSNFSGELFIYLVNGRKVLDTKSVNYSFNSLHRVFKTAFERGDLPEHPKNILMLGLGAGSIIELLRTQHQLNAPITAIEIDPAIIYIAVNEFNAHQYDPLNIINADAADWISQNTQTYDIICVDLFIHAEVPSEFVNTEFIDRLLMATGKQSTIYFNMMVMTPQQHTSFDSLYNYLQQKQGTAIHKVSFIEIEETNRVLIIRKF